MKLHVLRFHEICFVLVCIALAAACGGDDTTSGTGQGGQGGLGGSPTTSVSSTSSSSASSSSNSSSTSSSTSASSATGGSGGQGGAGGTGGTGQGGSGGTMGASAQIAVVLATLDGNGLSLPVEGALVTYEKPVLGQDPAGFFVQADQAGPALFVAVDPTTLTPVPAVGDAVDFTVTAVSTVAGLKQATAITSLSVVSSGNAIAPLVTDVSAATDLVTNLTDYESRAIRITGTIAAAFASAGTPQVAAALTTAGLSDPNLRLRMPEAVRAQYDLQMGCTVTVDYGVMWRFNTVAQPSALYAADLTGMACPAPTLVGAIAVASNQVLVSFDRALDPTTVDAADFTFDQGLTASAVSVSGADVTVTTSPQTGGLTYTVSAANLNDVLGAAVVTPNSATFTAYVSVAQMLFNELSPNIGSQHDLAEFLVTSAGSTNGIQLLQVGATVDTLATFPDVTVAAGDIIVVHINPALTTGIAPGSETTSKNQYPTATFSANYDSAWDFLGSGTTGLTNSDRVLRLVGPGGVVLDAVPVVLSTVATPPSAFPATLQALQAAGLWLPADCGGVLCTYTSTPSAIDISVDYVGVGTTATGNSVARKAGMNTKQKSDWNAAGAQSFGLPNP